MKKLMLFTLAIGVLVGNASAWEFKNNPDRRPSWAIGYWNCKIDGVAQRTEANTLLGFPLHEIYDTPTLIRTELFKPSVRLPLSDDVTIEIDWTYTFQDFDSSNSISAYRGKLQGSTWGGTFRKYF